MARAGQCIFQYHNATKHLQRQARADKKSASLPEKILFVNLRYPFNFGMGTMSNPVHDAFERAKRDFELDLKDVELWREILQTTSITEVYDATDRLQKEQAKDGRLRHLAKIEPYLTRLNDYSKAIEVFIQVKPDVLALIWGPIVLLLQWASALKTSFDSIVNTIEEIGLALPEFDQAGQLFGDKTQIQDVLLLFFRDILEFYRLAFRFFRLPREFHQVILR